MVVIVEGEGGGGAVERRLPLLQVAEAFGVDLDDVGLKLLKNGVFLAELLVRENVDLQLAAGVFLGQFCELGKDLPLGAVHRHLGRHAPGRFGQCGAGKRERHSCRQGQSQCFGHLRLSMLGG